MFGIDKTYDASAPPGFPKFVPAIFKFALQVGWGVCIVGHNCRKVTKDSSSEGADPGA